MGEEGVLWEESPAVNAPTEAASKWTVGRLKRQDTQVLDFYKGSIGTEPDVVGNGM